MPKKTKREKILADQHKSHMIIAPQPSFQFQAQTPAAVHGVQTSPTTSGDLSRMQKDLLKTVALAGIAIFSEIILSKFIR